MSNMFQNGRMQQKGEPALTPIPFIWSMSHFRVVVQLVHFASSAGRVVARCRSRALVLPTRKFRVHVQTAMGPDD